MIKLKNVIKTMGDEVLQQQNGGGSLYYAWQSNIAMAMFDVLQSRGLIKKGRAVETHKACNDGAKIFLDLLVRKG